MSSISRFKYIRNIPGTTSVGTPGFFRFDVKNMRQLTTQNFTAGSGLGIQSIVNVTVPASSWANGKAIKLRFLKQLFLPSSGAPPTYSIKEYIQITQSGGTLWPTPAAFTATPGTYIAWQEIAYIRIDPNIYVVDLGRSAPGTPANDMNGNSLIEIITAITPPFDYTQQITIEHAANLPASYLGANLSSIWAESFLEQGTNLGKLP